MNLLLLTGPPGCGKSTFIKRNRLEEITVCPDNLRVEIGGLVETRINGVASLGINQEVSQQAFSKAFKLIENLMQEKSNVILDATNTGSCSNKKINKLSKKYKYNVIHIDALGDLTLEDLIARNKSRIEYKRVPEKVIIGSYKDMINLRENNFFERKVLSMNEAIELLSKTK